jgi:hypothetical protein
MFRDSSPRSLNSHIPNMHSQNIWNPNYGWSCSGNFSYFEKLLAPQSNLFSFIPSVMPMCFQLVVMCVCVDQWPSKAITFFFLSQFVAPNDVTLSPHTFRSGLSPSLISPPLIMPNFGWLLCPPIKWWSSKAKGPSLSLFFDGLHFSAPSKGTSHASTLPALGT